MTDRVNDQIPAMCRFMRRRMAEEARAARADAGSPLAALVIADVRSRRGLLAWVESWNDKRGSGTWDVSGRDDDQARTIRTRMDVQQSMQGYALHYLLARYAHHPRFRPEWRVPQ